MFLGILSEAIDWKSKVNWLATYRMGIERTLTQDPCSHFILHANLASVFKTTPVQHWKSELVTEKPSIPALRNLKIPRACQATCCPAVINFKNQHLERTRNHVVLLDAILFIVHLVITFTRWALWFWTLLYKELSSINDTPFFPSCSLIACSCWDSYLYWSTSQAMCSSPLWLVWCGNWLLLITALSPVKEDAHSYIHLHNKCWCTQAYTFTRVGLNSYYTIWKFECQWHRDIPKFQISEPSMAACWTHNEWMAQDIKLYT